MDFMLTTIDNPYNPFKDFSSWWLYDIEHHYNSCELLDRLTNTSDQLTDEENSRDAEQAVDEFIKNDPLNIRIKVRNTK